MKPQASPQQISLLPPEGATLIHLVREKLRLLAELVTRYEVEGLHVAEQGPSIRTPADVAAYLGPEMAELAQEQLRAVLLNTKNRVVGTVLIDQGGLNAISVRLADCFREAVRANAAALILLHNHPSTDPTPSDEDIRVTHDASQAGDLLGIDVLDHLVLGGRAFCRLRERGLYTPRKYRFADPSRPAAQERRPRRKPVYQVHESGAGETDAGSQSSTTEEARAQHCRRIGQLGGQATLAKYGPEHDRALGKKGFVAAMESIGGAALSRHLAPSYRATDGREPQRLVTREEYRARQRVRAAARAQYPEVTCQVCGADAERHHVEGCDGPDAGEHVIGLCRQHHLEEHRTHREAAWQARHPS